MDFYKRKQKWKYALFIVAVIISSLSIYLTRSLENSLEEKNQVPSELTLEELELIWNNLKKSV